MRAPKHSTQAARARSAQSTIAVALAAAVGLGACSGATETSSVEIIHWWKQGGEAQAIKELLGEFKRQNPSVHIVDSSVDGSSTARALIRTRMNMMMLPPDTFQANGGWDLMAWVLSNNDSSAEETKMRELNPADLDLVGKVPPPVLDAVSYKGIVYGVPLNIHRLNTLFYNKDVFDKVGIQADSLNTLDDLFGAAEMVNQYNQDHPEATPIAPIALGYRATDGDVTGGDTWTLALVFFENIIVARMGGGAYRNLFLESQPDDAFKAPMSNALADFRRLIVSYSNSNAPSLTWAQPLDMVLAGTAAMTIMGDWGKGYVKAAVMDKDPFDLIGVMPTPGTAGTFVFTTDTFGLPIGAANPENALKLLHVFASQEGQDIFNPLKGSISARTDSRIDDPKYNYDALAKQTSADFLDAVNANTVVPATSILAPPGYIDAISATLAEFAKARDNGNPSVVQHTLADYSDLLASSCWPACRVPTQ